MIGRALLVGWLLAALVVLGMDGRLPGFLAGAVPGSLLALGLGALVRQQLSPSRYNQPSLPERYRVADDLGRPLVEVIAAAEQEATAGRPRRRQQPSTSTGGRRRRRAEDGGEGAPPPAGPRVAGIRPAASSTAADRGEPSSADATGTPRARPASTNTPHA